MCGFGNGNDNGIIWIIILLCLFSNNGCGNNGWGDNSSWIWIILLLCCCGNNNSIGSGCSSC
ncbi:MAG: chorion class high-cysteine HCB protein 13 [Anaerotignum sp.]|nr:chorion class high-cysteine HCB protein 13 [Anaerotignum sp.]